MIAAEEAAIIPRARAEGHQEFKTEAVGTSYLVQNVGQAVLIVKLLQLR